MFRDFTDYVNSLSLPFALFVLSTIFSILLIIYMLIYRNKAGFIAKMYSINEFKDNNKMEKILIILNILEFYIIVLVSYFIVDNNHFNTLFNLTILIACWAIPVRRKLLKKYDDKKKD